MANEDKKDKSLYIALPILIVGIILFSLIVPKLATTIISNVNGIEDFDIEEIFENLGSSFSGNENNTKDSYVATAGLDSNISRVNDNDILTSNSNDENLEFDISEFSGTYVDVFGSSDTLTIKNNGRVTISGRIITNSLEDLKKQSDGSYSCSIQGGNIIIYPVGVKSPQGNSGKVRIDVEEYGAALCFQEK